MTYFKLSREDLFNTKFKINYYDINEVNNEKLKKLFSLYQNKRAKENYTENALNYLLNRNRFLGFLELTMNDITTAFCCLSERNNWIVLTRFVKLSKRNRLPYAAGLFIPYVQENFIKEKKGIVMTFNDYNKVYYDMFDSAENILSRNYFKDIVDHDIYKNALNTYKLIKKLPEPIEHHNTMQWIAYISKNELIPFN